MTEAPPGEPLHDSRRAERRAGPAPATTRRRRVLIVASDFPPLGGTNVQRVVKFVKYLPRWSWDPIVVSQREQDLTVTDWSLMAEITAGTPVIRVANPDPLLQRWLRTRASAGRGPGDMGAPAADGSPSVSAPARAGRGASSPSSVIRAALRPLAPLVTRGFQYGVYVPDELRLWVRPAVSAGLRAVREHRPAILFTSAPAFSCLLVGLALKRRTGLPWVVDLRDLWVGRPYRRVKSRLHRRVEGWLERRALSAADRIVTASPHFIDALAARYGSAVRARCTWIPNGYDPDDYAAGAEPAGTDGIFHLVYTGAMFEQNPGPVLEALARLAAKEPDLTRPVRVTLAGVAGDADLASMTAIVRRGGLDSQVEFTGAVPFDRALAYQKAATVLLLMLGPDHAPTISGKCFEYLALGKPILAMIPTRGIQAEIFRGANVGDIVECGDVEAAEHALRRMLEAHRDGRLRVDPDWGAIRAYDRSMLARQLAELFDGLAE